MMLPGVLLVEYLMVIDEVFGSKILKTKERAVGWNGRRIEQYSEWMIEDIEHQEDIRTDTTYIQWYYSIRIPDDSILIIPNI